MNAAIAEAERELLAVGKCTRRFEEKCGEFSVVGIHDGFAGGSSYFDAEGRLVGREGSNCLGGDQDGVVPKCAISKTRELCDVAMSQLERLSLTLVVRASGAERRTVECVTASPSTSVNSARSRSSMTHDLSARGCESRA